MKNIFTFILITVTLSECQDDIQTKIPAFQTIKNGDFEWVSTVSTVTSESSGVTTFTGFDGFGTITIQIPNLALGSYALGSGALAVASYFEEGSQYSTIYDGLGSIVYVSDGLISIDDIDETGAVTGSFYFNAYNASGSDVVNFSEGILYKLPVTNQ